MASTFHLPLQVFSLLGCYTAYVGVVYRRFGTAMGLIFSGQAVEEECRATDGHVIILGLMCVVVGPLGGKGIRQVAGV
jgi:hypothetical protein